MRKDFISSNYDVHDETSFVEEFWTSVWEKEGGPRGQLERIGRQDEYLLISPHLAKLPTGASILDGGCGLGDWVLYLAKQGFNTIGIDISRKTVELLKERFPEANFLNGDIRNSGLDSDSFDAYFSWGVFEHFEAGPQDCIREAWRILKPGGKLFISVPLDNLRQSIIGTFSQPRQVWSGERFYQYRFTGSELARELSIGGFNVESFHPIHKRQGMLRCLHHEFHMPYHWFLTRGIAAILAPFVPGWFVAHMVLAIATKPLSTNERKS